METQKQQQQQQQQQQKPPQPQQQQPQQQPQPRRKPLQKEHPFTLYEAYVATRRPRILLAEDDAELRQLLCSVLRRDGFEVLEARDGSELLALIGRQIASRGEQGFKLIVSDIRMPGFTGLSILAGLRRAAWPTPVMLITGFGDAQTHHEARRLGAAAVFDKPFDVDDFRTAVINLIGSSVAEVV